MTAAHDLLPPNSVGGVSAPEDSVEDCRLWLSWLAPAHAQGSYPGGWRDVSASAGPDLTVSQPTGA